MGRQEKRNKVRTRKNKQTHKQTENNKIIDSSTNIPVVILNANDLNTPIKGQRLAEWFQKHDSIYGWKKFTSNTLI